MYSSKSYSSPHSHYSPSLSSWGNVSCSPPPPYSSPLPLPSANPAFQNASNLRMAPVASRDTLQPATNPPTPSLVLELTPHPERYPFIPPFRIACSLPLQNPNPLSVHDVLSFLHSTLMRPISKTDLDKIDQSAHDAAVHAFRVRTQGDKAAYSMGMCMGDRMGGAWVIVGVDRASEPGVWRVKLQ